MSRLVVLCVYDFITVLPVDGSLLLLLIDNDVVMAALKDINLEFSAQSRNCLQNRFHLGTIRDIDDVSAVAYFPSIT